MTTTATELITSARRNRTRPREVSTRSRLPRIAFWATLIALAVIVIAPLVFMLSTSLKPMSEIQGGGVSLIPQSPTLNAYVDVLTDPETPVLRWLGNSLFVALCHAVLVVVLATTAAYSLARMEFRGKKVLFALIMGTLFIPAVVYLIPHFLIVNELGWLNSYQALIIPSAAGAFGVFFLRQFFLGVPTAIEEAARIDGCNQWTIFWRIMVPLAQPAIVTLFVLSFLASWNDYLWPVFVMFSSDMQTLPAGLKLLQGANGTRYDILMAGAVVASIPVLLMYSFAQRFIIEGVAAGSVKG
ncbi:carbohydrate ABC transporter permease [Microbacterium sp. A94]|uniref:carbohydrate ABC transporter permease n=1 Tax=Microbacterium sp. A94 TaxID=3450717 RepID=UPI003F4351FE